MSEAAVSTALAVEVLGSEHIARGTLALRLSRPTGFDFKAGQSIDLVLPSMADAAAARRTLSIASAPADRELIVATRLRDSPFKKALASLQPGDRATFEGPFGSMTLHRAPGRDALLVAGGIGITPFRSMLRQAAHDRDPRRFTLLYSNNRPGDAPWLEELQALERSWAGFRLVATMTEVSGSEQPWDGERRRIDAELVAIAREGLASPLCYVAGPPAMIAAARAALAAADIDDDDVRGEEFFGY